MNSKTRAALATATLAAAAIPGAARMGAAHTQSGPAADRSAALLVEVHALRIALEQSAVVAPRVQLTLARLNIEEQRIAHLGTQLDQVRRELSTGALESEQLSTRLAAVEKIAVAATDDKIRKQFEYEQLDPKRKLATQSRLEEQLRSREGEISVALSAEQNRWVDLNARLDELERLLGPIPH